MSATFSQQGNQVPDIRSEIIFRLKVALLQVSRSYANLANPVSFYLKSDHLIDRSVMAESITPLWTSELGSEQELLAGKIQNLRVAIDRINGIEIPCDRVFSFWAQVGKPTRQKGYVAGREVRQGCIIPSIGGGLCQLSNALYSLALDAGFEIVERHAHTQIISGSLAEIGRDATVFWNYVDLRFRVDRTVRIEAFLTDSSLVVRLRSDRINVLVQPDRIELDRSRAKISDQHNCLTCNVSDCFRNAQPKSRDINFGKTAYLVDEYWIEFDQYIQSHKQDRDILGIPIDGNKFRKDNYKWTQTGFAKVNRSTLTTLMRAWESRNLPTQGNSRQTTLLKYDRKLAEHFSSLLTYDVTHVVVSQNLLPWLWQSGILQGRTFDVLITRSPLWDLQSKLNSAYQLHPESPTLNDFRVSTGLAEIESQALAQARQVITPHTEIASLFPDKAVLLNWHMPEVKTSLIKGDKILFPASTLGRKGAYELRAAAKRLNLELTILGNELEGDNFWDGLTIQHHDPKRDRDCLDRVGLVILPAVVEHKPRILLRSISHQIPVIASSACGLGDQSGVTIIPFGDVDSIVTAIKHLL